MKPQRIMIIAGETSGDMLAADLVRALQAELSDLPFPPEFFGAGGSRMAAAGVDLLFDMTKHSVIGLWEVIVRYRKFQELFAQLLKAAEERQPDLIICVDFSGFNRRFAAAIRERLRQRVGTFTNWHPKIVQYVSPQVWASRADRANQMVHEYDLLLSILPFEQAWYAQRTPRLPVVFVGNPILDRYANLPRPIADNESALPLVVLLPGSRPGEIAKHAEPMLAAAELIARAHPVRLRAVLPSEALAEKFKSHPLAQALGKAGGPLTVQIGGLPDALQAATAAIASTGTVTLECAYFGVPTVAIYKTSWLTYQIGKRIVQVRFLAMPNLLADEAVFPELIQDDATAEKIAREALSLLKDDSRRANIQRKLVGVVKSLGEPGASARAAKAILQG